jgi:hypothetical protein
MLQEGGVAKPLEQVKPAPPPPPPKPWWKRVSTLIKAGLGLVGTVVTIVPALYLSMSVDWDFNGFADDPFASSFNVEYEGLIPLTKVQILCAATVPGSKINHNITDAYARTGKSRTAPDRDVTDWLYHGGRIAFTCDSLNNDMGSRPKPAPRYPNSSTLGIMVEFKFLGMNLMKLFPFSLYSDSQGQYHWQKMQTQIVWR